jgi:hypothetical protein
MSMSSRNTSVTSDMPSFVMLRVVTSPGMPAMARSTGCVTCSSSSFADRALACVTTCTWMLVTSGTASMGRRSADQPPSASMAPISSNANSGLAADQRIRPLIA